MSQSPIRFGNFVSIDPSVALAPGNEYPFIAMEDVFPRQKSVMPGQRRIWNRSGGAKFCNGDILFARITPCLEHGKTAKVSGLPEISGFGSTEFIVFRGKPGVSDPDYVYYLAHSDIIRGPAIKSMTGASGRQRAQRAVIEEILISAPSIIKQKQIADVLSTYDDLIENNRRRIKLLEESARLLYREWFVHFRFPGHEHVKYVEGAPSGWERVNFAKTLSAHIGGGWGQDEHTAHEYSPAYVIRGTDFESIHNGDFDSIGLRHHKPSSLSSRILTHGDIVFEISGGSANQSIGRTLLITSDILSAYDAPVICASFCKRFVPISLDIPFYLISFIRHIRETGELLIYNKNSASALQNFNFEAFMEKQFVLLPPRRLLLEFNDVMSNINKQMVGLAMQNHKLKKARDILLPRLMNGAIQA